MKFFLICFVSAASLIAAAPSSTEDRAEDCVTINGPQKGAKCVFPFKARGKEYTTCTKAGGYKAAWCSTKTDAKGDTILGNYGDCSDKCPTEDGASEAKTEDGASEAKTEDGASEAKTEDGASETKTEDGASETKTEDGASETKTEDGASETKTEDGASETKAGACVTINGPQKGAKCVFPFKARGKEYNKCTKAGGYKAAWCSTKTDEKGDTILGNFGDCSQDCPIGE